MTSGLGKDEKARLEGFLGPSRIAVVATIDLGGVPHLTPNWYRFADGRLTMSTRKETVKSRNLSRDGRITVCICSEPLAESYATIWGRAEISDGESIWPETRAIVERYVAPERVDERMSVLRSQNRVIVSVVPERVVFGA